MRWKISCITLILIIFFSFSLSQTSAEETKNSDASEQTSAPSSKAAPDEPENLDEPMHWQEGDPEPIEKTVPAVEPEQTSDKAPPSQPIDDERPEQTSPDHAWVSGYWWWTNGSYFWVPGYWAMPPLRSLRLHARVLDLLRKSMGLRPRRVGEAWHYGDYRIWQTKSFT